MSRPSQNFPNQEERLAELKIEICHAIDLACMRQGLNQRQAAILMGTSRSTVSAVQNKRLHRLTVGQLFHYLAKIHPHFRFFLSIDR